MSLSTFSVIFLALMCGLTTATVQAQQEDAEPKFNSISMAVLRSPDPVKLSKFYEALGMQVADVAENGAVFFNLEDDGDLFEILNMDESAKPGGPKTTRTQQGVVALINVSDAREVARRAEGAGSPLVEPLGDPETAFVFYIADWENNILGFITPPPANTEN